MTPTFSKDEILCMIQDLPGEHITLEDLIERLVVLDRVRKGPAQKPRTAPDTLLDEVTEANRHPAAGSGDAVGREP